MKYKNFKKLRQEYCDKYNITIEQFEYVMKKSAEIGDYILLKDLKEHSEDNLGMSHIKLSETEKKLLCQKGSLVGTDAKEPETELCEYVEKLINEYVRLTLISGNL